MIQLLKDAIKKIAYGLLYGIGFGIAASSIWYVISEKMVASMWNQAAFEKVVISKHEKIKRNETVIILGTIENRGSKAVRTISVQVDLFDKNGKFVEQCSEYVQGALKPGEDRNFKVSCGGCKEKPIVEHESYKIRLIGL